MGSLDPKLRIKQIYITRCENCLERNEWLLRDTNVNVGMTDDDVYRLSYNVGNTDRHWCDHCNASTLQTEVAYPLTPTQSGKEK